MDSCGRVSYDPSGIRPCLRFSNEHSDHIARCRTLFEAHEQLKRSDADAELGAYGVANIFHAVFILAFLALAADYISHIPIPALAGVTAYIGICLLEWATWRRLPKMSRVNALAFLSIATAVLTVNAVLAVGIACSFYLFRYLYHRLSKQETHEESVLNVAPPTARFREQAEQQKSAAATSRSATSTST